MHGDETLLLLKNRPATERVLVIHQNREVTKYAKEKTKQEKITSERARIIQQVRSTGFPLQNLVLDVCPQEPQDRARGRRCHQEPASPLGSKQVSSAFQRSNRLQGDG
jgi:hypothetical protein